MYLFEAIRLGSVLRPQAFGDLYKDNGSCAWGAAYEACGLQKYATTASAHELRKHDEEMWPISAIKLDCPSCGRFHDEINYIIAEHLNDKHKWTREQIAAWLEPIELAYYQEHPEYKPKDVEEPKIETPAHDLVNAI